jgi:hypothetical protein
MKRSNLAISLIVAALATAGFAVSPAMSAPISVFPKDLVKAVSIDDGQIVQVRAARGEAQRGHAARGGTVHRGGAAAGGGAVVRGGAAAGGGAVVRRGAVVTGGSSGGGTCDPSYQNCSGGGYSGGGAVVTGGGAAVKGGAAVRGGAAVKGGTAVRGGAAGHRRGGHRSRA